MSFENELVVSKERSEEPSFGENDQKLTFVAGQIWNEYMHTNRVDYLASSATS